MKALSGSRWAVRLLVLAAAVALAMGGPLPAWGARVIPALSPLSVLAAAWAQQRWFAGFFWGAPPLLLLAAAVWRGRVFCHWCCPAGTLFSAAAHVPGRGRFERWKKQRALSFRFPRVNVFLFWFLAGSTLAGTPLLLALDPLSAASRLAPLARGLLSAAALVPGLLIPLFLLATLVQPMAWCTRCCPLGYFFDLLHGRASVWRKKADPERRLMLAGLLGSLPLAAWARRRVGRRNEDPVLPPGALEAGRFGAVCIRCYACIGTCPTGILRVAFPSGPLLGWFQPQMNADYGGCDPDCAACGRACPTGAIRALATADKQRLRIGTAVVRREACLAWADDTYCLVCEEHCPYRAIDADTGSTGIPRPVVDPERCRGCGYCQLHCPAVRAGKAIVVQGLPRQEPVRDPRTRSAS